MQRLLSVFKKDVTHLYAASVEDICGLTFSDSQRARLLSSHDLKPYTNNPRYDLSLSSANTIDGQRNFCCATFLGETLTAYGFFARGVIPPEYNTAGIGYGGIGFQLPANTLYMYKVFVLPEFRGQNQVISYVQHCVTALLPKGGWVIASTGENNFAAQGMFKKMGFKKIVHACEYRLLGIGMYKMPKNITLGQKDAAGIAKVQIISGPTFVPRKSAYGFRL